MQAIFTIIIDWYAIFKDFPNIFGDLASNGFRYKVVVH